MKPRRMMLELEVDTDAPLSALRKVRGARLYLPGSDAPIGVQVHQVSANVIQAAPSRPQNKRRR